MIESRRLINEIPSGKFHSALMTTFSINLHYWEGQLLKTLSRKGINYVSAVVDADCLSDQLLFFNSTREGRPPKFSLHGYRSEGAFHPKIQFYVGKDTILALVGSGNISISGHGKNLEIWNPIMVNSAESPLYAIILGIWEYISSIYRSLGPEAREILETVKENCELLKNAGPVGVAECTISEDISLKFFANGEKTLMDQCHEWIGEEKIKNVVIMSPFHDKKAAFIDGLIKLYNPKSIDLILQKNFGVIPDPKSIPSIVKVYDWADFRSAATIKQKYFHAKCLFLEGTNSSYLICGSANSSIAAFGRSGGESINHEACIGYKLPRKSFYELIGIPKQKPIDKADLITYPQHEGNAHEACDKPSIWIKEALWEYGKIVISVDEDDALIGTVVHIYSSSRRNAEAYNIDKCDNSKIELPYDSGFVPYVVEITDNTGRLLSNRQFIISAMTMMENNPSPEDARYRRMCNALESDGLISESLCNFVFNVLLEKQAPSPSSSDSVKRDDKNIVAHHFGSVEEYMAGNKAVDNTLLKRKAITHSLKSTMLIDSILSYITRSSQQKKTSEIDHEEMENISTSQGSETVQVIELEEFSDAKAERLRVKLISTLDKYLEQLKSLSDLPDKKQGELCLSDSIKKFYAALMVIGWAIYYRFNTNKSKNQNLVHIPAGVASVKTLTHYLYKVIDSYAVLTMKYRFKPEENDYVAHRNNDQKSSIYPLAIAMLAVVDWLNEGNQSYVDYSNFYKISSLMNIKMAVGDGCEVPSVPEILRHIEKRIQEMPGFDQSIIEGYIRNNISLLACGSEGVYLSSDYGYVSLKPYKVDKFMYLPCSLVFEYNTDKAAYCPDSVYHTKAGRILQLTKKSHY